jgi:hypothetical protein
VVPEMGFCRWRRILVMVIVVVMSFICNMEAYIKIKSRKGSKGCKSVNWSIELDFSPATLTLFTTSNAFEGDDFDDWDTVILQTTGIVGVDYLLTNMVMLAEGRSSFTGMEYSTQVSSMFTMTLTGGTGKYCGLWGEADIGPILYYPDDTTTTGFEAAGTFPSCFMLLSYVC